MASIGFIGVGNMGGAIIKGIDSQPDLQILGFDPDREKLDALCAATKLSPVQEIQELQNCDYILLAVKPQILKSVAYQLKEFLRPQQCLLSIAAGVELKKILKWTNSICPAVRIMPNAPALIQSGSYAVCFDCENLLAQQKEFITELFSGIGQVHILAENYFDAFTGLIGSGPAYVFAFMEALIDAGVSQGLPRNQATEMVQSLMLGSARMSKELDLHVTQLKEMVTSPGGTTIAGLDKMDKYGLRYAVGSAVKAATKRSKELG